MTVGFANTIIAQLPTSGDASAALALAVSKGAGRRIIIPAGSYQINSKITVPAGVAIEGELSTSSGNQTKLTAGAAIAGGMIESTGQISISNLVLDCANLADNGLNMATCTGPQAWVNNIMVTGSVGDAMIFDQCQTARWGKLVVEGECGGHGLNFIDCNDLHVQSIRAAQFPGAFVADKYGVRIAGETTSGGAMLDQVQIENNWYGGVLVESASARPVVRNLRTEIGAVDHIVIRKFGAGPVAAGVTIENAMLIGGNGTYASGTYNGQNNRCIRAEDAWICNVRNLLVSGGAGTTWRRPLLGSGCYMWTIDGATYHSQAAPSLLPIDYVAAGTHGGHNIRTVAAFEAPAAPTTGFWYRGARVWNTVPASGQPMGWICVASGTPGTWLSMGNLS